MKKRIEEKLNKYYEGKKEENKLVGFFEYDGEVYSIEKEYTNKEETKKEIIELANDGEDECLGFLDLRKDGNWTFEQEVA